MRAISLTSAAAMLLLGLGLSCQAQTSDKSNTPQSLTGPAGKDTPAAPDKAKTGEAKTGEAKTGETKTGETKTGETKTGETKTGEIRKDKTKTGAAITKADAKSRVNTLSPEEQRRAARARERRAATKTAKEPVDRSKTVDKSKSGDKVAAPAAAPAGNAPQHPVATAVKRSRTPPVADARPRRAHASRSGADLARRGGWPRVGDVVPRGVPLYAVPPGYRARPYAGPGYMYREPGPYGGGPGYPPFPRYGQAYQAYPAYPRGGRGDVDIDDDN